MPAKDSRILYLSDNQQSRKDCWAKGLRVGNEQVSFPLFILQCFKELLFCCCKGTVFMTEQIDLSQSSRGNRHCPWRNGKIPWTYDFILPKYLFSPRSRMFVSHGAIRDFLGRDPNNRSFKSTQNSVVVLR